MGPIVSIGSHFAFTSRCFGSSFTGVQLPPNSAPLPIHCLVLFPPPVLDGGVAAYLSIVAGGPDIM
jgi:hypothetical protein